MVILNNLSRNRQTTNLPKTLIIYKLKNHSNRISGPPSIQYNKSIAKNFRYNFKKNLNAPKKINKNIFETFRDIISERCQYEKFENFQ